MSFVTKMGHVPLPWLLEKENIHCTTNLKIYELRVVFPTVSWTTNVWCWEPTNHQSFKVKNKRIQIQFWSFWTLPKNSGNWPSHVPHDPLFFKGASFDVAWTHIMRFPTGAPTSRHLAKLGKGRQFCSPGHISTISTLPQKLTCGTCWREIRCKSIYKIWFKHLECEFA